MLKNVLLFPFVPVDSPLYNQYSVWLSQNLPLWANFSVSSFAEYLGFEVGPSAGAHQWDKVLNSFKHHLASVTHSGAPTSVSVFTYNVKLVPKFSYKAQLSPPHSTLDVDEHKWAANVLKSPFKSFPPSLLFYGKSHGFYQLSSILLQSVSAAIRASWSTVKN